jgi:hypothetical protein
MNTHHELDGVLEASDSEVSEFVKRATDNDQIGSVGVFTDAESLKRYHEYMREHRARMRTFGALQGEYMGRPRRGRSGEFGG